MSRGSNIVMIILLSVMFYSCGSMVLGRKKPIKIQDEKAIENVVKEPKLDKPVLVFDHDGVRVWKFSNNMNSHYVAVSKTSGNIAIK